MLMNIYTHYRVGLIHTPHFHLRIVEWRLHKLSRRLMHLLRLLSRPHTIAYKRYREGNAFRSTIAEVKFMIVGNGLEFCYHTKL